MHLESVPGCILHKSGVQIRIHAKPSKIKYWCSESCIQEDWQSPYSMIVVWWQYTRKVLLNKRFLNVCFLKDSPNLGRLTLSIALSFVWSGWVCEKSDFFEHHEAAKFQGTYFPFHVGIILHLCTEHWANCEIFINLAFAVLILLRSVLVGIHMWGDCEPLFWLSCKQLIDFRWRTRSIKRTPNVRTTFVNYLQVYALIKGYCKLDLSSRVRFYTRPFCWLALCQAPRRRETTEGETEEWEIVFLDKVSEH